MNNVLEFKFNNGFDHINFFLESLETESTKISYHNSIKLFLKWKYDIPIEHSQPEHWNNVTYTDMERYKSYLRRKYAANTTNNKLEALYSLMKKLNKFQDEEGKYLYNINVDRLRVKPINAKASTEEYGFVEWEEMDDWIKWLSSLPERKNPKGKAMWIELSRLTGIRKQGLADLCFKDLKKEDGVYTLTHSLKGKKRKIPIPNDIAEKLLELRKTNNPNEKILHMSTKTMERTFKEILEHFNIQPERNVVIHSMRGESGYESYLSSGKDPLVAKEHLGHEDFNTTMRYINKRSAIQKSPTLYMGRKFTEKDIDGLDSEQWKEIYNELSRSAKYEIKNIMDKLGYSQE